jgi:hypothetical protein
MAGLEQDMGQQANTGPSGFQSAFSIGDIRP